MAAWLTGRENKGGVMKKGGVLPVLHSSLEIYEMLCKPLCKELGMPQAAFDILMFLANNPEYYTAKDIVKYRGIRANLVSLYVDKLVNAGYLEREPIQGNRRSIKLSCTARAKSVILEGHQIQARFYELLFAGIDGDERERFHHIMEICGRNIMKAKDEIKGQLKTEK